MTYLDCIELQVFFFQFATVIGILFISFKLYVCHVALEKKNQKGKAGKMRYSVKRITVLLSFGRIGAKRPLKLSFPSPMKCRSQVYRGRFNVQIVKISL